MQVSFVKKNKIISMNSAHTGKYIQKLPACTLFTLVSFVKRKKLSACTLFTLVIM